MIKIAGAQIDVVFDDREKNLVRIGSALRETAKQGARLTTFPECALPGYCFESLEEARPHAEPIPGPSTQRLADLCRELDVYIYYMAVNRVGAERGFRFIGKSKICGPGGELLAVANHEEETILYAEIDPAKARRKRVIRVPGKHEIDRFADRRPEMYGRLVEGK